MRAIKVETPNNLVAFDTLLPGFEVKITRPDQDSPYQLRIQHYLLPYDPERELYPAGKVCAVITWANSLMEDMNNAKEFAESLAGRSEE
jgi:hypothetical protein